uniref:Uncharacterized protein n=1 Tax=Steinernema glaseri TaxID=37863 RepID=A0A1I7YL38_9BILA
MSGCLLILNMSMNHNKPLRYTKRKGRRAYNVGRARVKALGEAFGLKTSPSPSSTLFANACGFTFCTLACTISGPKHFERIRSRHSLLARFLRANVAKWAPCVLQPHSGWSSGYWNATRWLPSTSRSECHSST